MQDKHPIYNSRQDSSGIKYVFVPPHWLPYKLFSALRSSGTQEKGDPWLSFKVTVILQHHRHYMEPRREINSGDWQQVMDHFTASHMPILFSKRTKKNEREIIYKEGR